MKKKIRTKVLSLENKELRQLGVLIEDARDEIKLVAEQYGDIKKTLQSHTEMIGSVMKDIEIIKMDIQFIKGAAKMKVDIAEFAVLERRVALLERRR